MGNTGVNRNFFIQKPLYYDSDQTQQYARAESHIRPQGTHLSILAATFSAFL